MTAALHAQLSEVSTTPYATPPHSEVVGERPPDPLLTTHVPNSKGDAGRVCRRVRCRCFHAGHAVALHAASSHAACALPKVGTSAVVLERGSAMRSLAPPSLPPGWATPPYPSPPALKNRAMGVGGSFACWTVALACDEGTLGLGDEMVIDVDEMMTG